ncbi:MAG: SsrA-binding protein SmpB [Candidatus Paceibacterota bacterium]
MSKSLITNKKAHLNYEFLEKFNAGIELFGFEVKALRENQGSLEGAHVVIRNNEAYLVNTHIPPYQPANTPKEYDPYRTRRLLLTKKEIRHLSGVEKQQRLTIVPISMYNDGNKIKVEIAIVRGKKKFDKREDIKKRETDRDIRRSLKRE